MPQANGESDVMAEPGSLGPTDSFTEDLYVYASDRNSPSVPKSSPAQLEDCGWYWESLSRYVGVSERERDKHTKRERQRVKERQRDTD